MINLEDLLSITGVSGIYKSVATRSNGMIVEDLDTRQHKFFSNRQHQFLPLATVGIYVDEEIETMDLGNVLQLMKDQEEQHPLPAANASDTDLRNYFSEVLPKHDRYRVKNSDIKKLVRWYSFLKNKNLLLEKAAEVAAEEPADEKGEKNDKVEKVEKKPTTAAPKKTLKDVKNTKAMAPAAKAVRNVKDVGGNRGNRGS